MMFKGKLWSLPLKFFLAELELGKAWSVPLFGLRTFSLWKLLPSPKELVTIWCGLLLGHCEGGHSFPMSRANISNDSVCTIFHFIEDIMVYMGIQSTRALKYGMCDVYNSVYMG